MRNLADNHLSIKQSVLNSLINSPDNGDTHYNNVRASLLNNGIVYALPENFNISDFTTALKDFFDTTLKTKTDEQTIGDDIFTLNFSPIGLGLMKKTVVYSILDNHIYINIVPTKEIENSNYSEGMISELISSGKNGQIYSFTENYILKLYPEEIVETVQKHGRYFYTSDFGLRTILAYHLEPQEIVLAKLDIYKVETSKSNSQTETADKTFFVMTTNGSYLFVIDSKAQEKYIETLTNEAMIVHSKIGRDTVECGSTKWITNRDNDFLFSEIQELNTESREKKLKGFSVLNFNFAENDSEKEYSAQMMRQFAEEHNSLFANFAAEFILYSSKKGKDYSAKALMDKANSLFSETEFEKKLKKFLNDFKFSAKEIVTLIFVISRVKNRIEDTVTFRDTMIMLKDKYFKLEEDELNRAFVEVSIAKKLECIGERQEARKLSDSALERINDKTLIELLPVKDSGPEMPYSTSAIYYAANEEMFKLSDSDNDKLKFAKNNAIEKPLIKKNLDNLSKYLVEGNQRNRLDKAISIFDVEKFNSAIGNTEFPSDNKFSKIPIKDLDDSLTKGHVFYDLTNWLTKVLPDKEFSSIKDHGEKVTEMNYPQLNSIVEICKDYFELPEVGVYVVFNRNQGIFSNDDGESKFIIIDGESLDTANVNYMNLTELMFQLSKEFANLKLGISRLSSHLQWRNFNPVGITSIDIISQFAPASNFVEPNLKNYSKQLKFSELLTLNQQYFNFDVEDTDYASKMLESTINALSFNGLTKPENLREMEFAALSSLTNQITDKIALLLTDDIVFAIKSIVHNDRYIKGGVEFLKDNCVADLAISKSDDGKPVNYDFSMRINSLVGFYLSDSYEKLRKNIKKN